MRKSSLSFEKRFTATIIHKRFSAEIMNAMIYMRQRSRRRARTWKLTQNSRVFPKFILCATGCPCHKILKKYRGVLSPLDVSLDWETVTLLLISILPRINLLFETPNSQVHSLCTLKNVSKNLRHSSLVFNHKLLLNKIPCNANNDGVA